MLTINTQFDSVYLTTLLPEELEISTNNSSVDVRISVGPVLAYESTLYPYNGKVVVSELRSIVEAGMKSAGYGVQLLNIEVSSPEEQGTTLVDDIMVVYATYKVQEESSDFLSENFLMSDKSVLLSQRDTTKLYYYHDGSVQEQISAEINYIPMTGTSRVYTYNWNGGNTSHSASENHLRSVTVGFVPLMRQLLQATGIAGKVVSAVYHIGARAFTMYFTNELPVETFSFINAFGCRETASVFGKETLKTKTEHSEAVLKGKSQYYDEQTKVTHEIETAPMTYNQAVAMNQLLTSPEVKRVVSNLIEEPVLISDLSSEISSSDKDEIKLKFSWRYADGTEWK